MAHQIELKVIQIKLPGAEQKVPMAYREMMVDILKSAPPGQQGVSMDDILQAAPLIRKLEKAEDGVDFLFEDAEFTYLLNRLSAHRFGLATPEIADFIVDIRDSVSVDITPPA
jgi:hypothetical protein